MTTFGDVRPLKCESISSVEGNFKGHKKIDSGENLFRCSVCEKRLSENGHIQSHLATHEDGEAFECATPCTPFNCVHLILFQGKR